MKNQNTKRINHGYYVYAFLDPRIAEETKTDIITFTYRPFYIGKGTEKRINNTSRNPKVNTIIKEIKSQSKEPLIIKLIEGITNLHAYRIENSLIYQIGREDLNRGPLLNLTGGINQLQWQAGEEDLNIEKHINRLIITALNLKPTIALAAKALGISERDLYRKITALRIERVGGIYRFKG